MATKAMSMAISEKYCDGINGGQMQDYVHAEANLVTNNSG